VVTAVGPARRETAARARTACALAAGAVAAAALAAIVAASGCVDPEYHCRVSHDCDVGEDGRCEVDHHCTAYDAGCATHRRYTDHSGPASNACFDDAVVPANLCAAGQPPAVSTGSGAGCAASVCKALPSCCATGWSEACVQEAQVLCSDLVCDTRIALTAGDKAGAAELWDLEWTGTRWTVARDVRTGALAWLAPLPGETAPRLAGFSPDALLIDAPSSAAAARSPGTTSGPMAIPVDANHDYVAATSVDFDRDGRPTAVLGYTDAAGTPHLEITKLDDGTKRTANTFASGLAWGDLDHDAFPDGLAAAAAPGSGTYRLLSNIEAADRSRLIGPVVETMMQGGNTPGAPAVRGFDWLDANRDHQLDAVAFGSEVNLHLGQRAGLTDTPQVRIDCTPLGPSASCSAAPSTQPDQAFAAAAVPEASGAALVIATFPAAASGHPPTLHRAELGGAPFGLGQVATYALPACTAPCPRIIALVARDLDGDHQLDVVAIDSELQVYTALGSELTLTRAIKLPTALSPVFAVRTSVSGAPR
jgi:hypothetical protein